MSVEDKIALYTVDRRFEGTRTAQDVVSALIHAHS